MRYYYATLDENDIVKGVSNLSGEVNQPNMISIDEAIYDSDLIGKKYVNGEFIEIK